MGTGTGAGGQQSLMNAETPDGQDNGDVGPQGFMSKIGGFLKKPGVGESMMAAGARMMQGSPDGTFATIGHGLETGLDTYEGLKEGRQVEEDRAQKLADRERSLAAVETLKTGLTEEQQAAIDAAIGGGDYPAAYELAESYAREAKLDEAFDEAGGKFITDPYLYQVVKAMPPTERNAYLLEFRDSEKGREGRAMALRQLFPHMSEEDAKILAEDASAVDRILSRPNDRHIVTDGKGQNWIVNLAPGQEGYEVKGPIGEARIDLDAEQLGLQQAEADAADIKPMFDSIQDSYVNLLPRFHGLQLSEAALDILDRTVEEWDADPDKAEPFIGVWSEWKKDLARHWGSPRAATTEELDNILLGLGITALDNWRGSITEKEMEQALKSAGTLAELQSSLRAILAAAVARTGQEMELHNTNVLRLRDHNVTDWDYWQLDPERLDALLKKAAGPPPVTPGSELEFAPPPRPLGPPTGASGVDVNEIANAQERDQVRDNYRAGPGR